MLHTNLAINEKGHLAFAGRDCVELAEKYQTPLYLMDEDRVRASCKVYVNAMRKYFDEYSVPLYASKALCFKDMYKIAAEEGSAEDAPSDEKAEDGTTDKENE